MYAVYPCGWKDTNDTFVADDEVILNIVRKKQQQESFGKKIKKLKAVLGYFNWVDVLVFRENTLTIKTLLTHNQ